MTLSDVILIVAYGLFVAIWWLKAAGPRRMILGLVATIGLAASLWGVLDDRWQAYAGIVAGAVFLLAVWADGKAWLLRHRMARTVVGVLLSLAGAIAITALVAFPVFKLPAPSGERPVGVRTFELADTSRRGVLSSAPLEPRRLLIRVWYPAENTGGVKARPYFDTSEAKHTAPSLAALAGFKPFFSYLKHVRTNSYEDAPLMAGAHGLPTVIYSHGYTSFLGQNAALMEELASHGYVVFSIQHTYDSAATFFPDGDVLPMDPALVRPTTKPSAKSPAIPEALIKGYTARSLDERLEGQLDNWQQALDHQDRYTVISSPRWVLDRQFVQDRLRKGAVPRHVADIATASDLSRIGAVGMSFGGSTAGAICMVDPHCAAAVNLDGRDVHFVPFDADTPRPFLMFYSDLEYAYRHLGPRAAGVKYGYNDFSYENFDHAGTREDVFRLQLMRTTHPGISDFSLFMRRPWRDSLWGSAPAEVIIGSQNEFVRGFFDRYLRGIANEFPDAQYKKYKGWVLPHDNSAVRLWWQSKSATERESIRSRIAELKARLPKPNTPQDLAAEAAGSHHATTSAEDKPQ